MNYAAYHSPLRLESSLTQDAISKPQEVLRMKVKINGIDKEFMAGANLNELIAQFSQQNSRIIAEVNGCIVKGRDWQQTPISEGDTIELVSFVGGG